MRANESRMRPWWPPVDDWEKATDAVAYVDHYRDWRSRMRSGSGLILVVSGPSGVIGEITTWNLTPGGHTGEAGVWVYPKISRRFFMPLWAAYFDNCFGNLGLETVSAPVAIGNGGPLRLISDVGGALVGRLPGGRDIAGRAHDQDLYCLTKERWCETRQALYARHPWETITKDLPLLG